MQWSWQRRLGFILTLAIPLTLYWAIADKLSWRPRTLLKAPALTIAQVTFSPDGKTLAASMFKQDSGYYGNIAGSSAGSKIELWDVAGEKLLRQMVIRSGKIGSVSFIPDRNSLASLEWALLKERPLHDPHDVEGRMQTTRMAIKLWNPQTGRLQRTFARNTDTLFRPDYPVPNYAFYLAPWPDKTRLTFFCARSGMQQYNLQTGKLWPTGAYGTGPVALVPNGWMRASAPESSSIDDGVRLWDQRTRKQLHLLPYRDLKLKPSNLRDLHAQALVFAPDGKLLASAIQIITANPVTGSDHVEVRILLWDTATGQLRQMISGLHETVRAFAFAPDESRLASAGVSNVISLWDVSSGCKLRSLEGHKKAINSIAFSPDGYTLASGSDDGTLKLWRIR